MKYCVIKGTTKVIDGSFNDDFTMIKNATNAGFSSEEVEILTQEEYDDRKSLYPETPVQHNENEVLMNYILSVDMRLVMIEMGLL